MKTKLHTTATAAAVHLATLKATKQRRIVEAEEKLTQAAKVRFKSAKKTWRLARKTAKRSAKKLKRAEKQLAALEKELNRTKTKTGKKSAGKTVGDNPTKPTGRNRRRTTITAPPSATSASSPVLPQNSESPQG